MAQKLPWTPWREAVRLRDDLKTGELSLAVSSRPSRPNVAAGRRGERGV